MENDCGSNTGSKRRLSRIRQSFTTKFFSPERNAGAERVFLFAEGEEGEGEENSCSFGAKYERLDLVGEGSAGSVWRCKERASGEIFAVKVMRTRDGETLANFRREFSHLKGLFHRNVVETRELYVNTSEGAVYLVMEYFEGREMSEVISELGYFSEGVAKNIFHQLLSGVQFLHRNGIVHRDLKPSNILISPSQLTRPPTENHRLQCRGLLRSISLYRTRPNQLRNEHFYRHNRLQGARNVPGVSVQVG